MPLLEVNNVVSGYGEMQVLRGVSLRVEQHEIVSIIGPNGAGKSNVMKLIFGLLKPWEGSVAYNCEQIGGLNPEQIVRKGTCYVTQIENIFSALTVEGRLE